MTSAGLATPRSSSRPLPAGILLLLAALAVALGPALGERSVSTAAEAAHLVVGAAGAGTVGTVGKAVEPDASDRIQGGTAGDERSGTAPTPGHIGLRHGSAGPAGIERPTFQAVLPGVVVADPLLILTGSFGRNERGGGLGLPRGSARGPPASRA